MDKSYVTGFSEDIIWLCYIVCTFGYVFRGAYIFIRTQAFRPKIFVKQGQRQLRCIIFCSA
jgi:hypothetical protein